MAGRIALSLAIAAGLAAGLAACGSPDPSSDALSGDPSQRPRVVATSTIIADLAEDVAGEEVELIGLVPPGDDPHIYEPVPDDIKAIETADLILYNGYNLEPGLIRLTEAAPDSIQRLAVAEVVEPLAQAEGQRQPDPHVWGDAENAIAMVNAIRDALVALSPEDEAVFDANAEQLNADLRALDRWIAAQIQTIPAANRRLVTTHDAFQYYTEAYGLEMLGTLIGISTEEQPSVQTVQALVKAIRATQIPAIFAETTINDQLIRTVAEEANVALAPQELYSDSVGSPGSPGDSYLKMMVANTESIVKSLGGDFSPPNF